jgi:hypothetical protein
MFANVEPPMISHPVSLVVLSNKPSAHFATDF